MLGVALMGFAGFAGLCLAMEKHFNDLLGRKPTGRQLRALKLAGWALLLLSLLFAVLGAAFASLVLGPLLAVQAV